MGLLDGQIASAFASAFGPMYLDGTLHRATLTQDGVGGGSLSFADEAVNVQRDQATQAMMTAPGYVESDRRYIMLAYGHAEPDTDCELTADGTRWSVVDWDEDPAQSYYGLHVRRKA